MIKTGSPVYTFMPLAVMPFFILTTPQINYFNLRILLFIWSIHLFKPFRSTVGLVMLFLTESLVVYGDLHNVRYHTTSTTSVCLTAYFLFVVVSHAPEVLGTSTDAGLGFRRYLRPVGIISLALLLLALPHFYYRHLEDKALFAEPIDYEALSKVKEEGTPWNAPGNVVIKGYGIDVDLKGVSHGRELSISLDGNDVYRVELYHRGAPVDLIRTAKRHQKDHGGTGLKVHEIHLRPQTSRQGFDHIKIIPAEGDGSYSVGHLVVRSEGE